MKILSKCEELKGFPSSNLRIIAVSATIPNIKDIAEWLEVAPDDIEIFGGEHRAVQLEKHVLGYNMVKNEFQFEQSLNYRLLDVIRKYSDGRPALVFCQTQKGCLEC
jgi:ATP-dependent DNA helicase HFM1/MER3